MNTTAPFKGQPGGLSGGPLGGPPGGFLGGPPGGFLEGPTGGPLRGPPGANRGHSLSPKAARRLQHLMQQRNIRLFGLAAPCWGPSEASSRSCGVYRQQKETKVCTEKTPEDSSRQTLNSPHFGKKNCEGKIGRAHV